jgi:predicted PurR-regulated permease PerM
MNPTFKYVLIGLGIIILLAAIWYFQNIVAYILISAVLALLGKPVVDLMGKIRYRNLFIPIYIRALITLLLIWGVFFIFFSSVIPLVIHELDSLTTLSPDKIIASFREPIQNFEHLIDKYQLNGREKFSIENFLTQKVVSIFNATSISKFFNSLASLVGNVFIAAFSISFITFFFLRDQNLFNELVLTIVPDQYEESFKRAMSSTRHLLVRYFVGIIGQLSGIFILVTLGLTIVGVGFGDSLLIGLIAASVNIIPYIGPLIGSIVGIIIGMAANINLDFSKELIPLFFLIVLVFIIVHLIDNFIFQPFIFSNRVHAHPLEIFLVILIAGSLAGVLGMILAIPSYTVLRVFAKEFFNNFTVVKKLTKNIN